MTIVVPKLKALHSPDIFQIDNASVDSKVAFCILVQAMFGPANTDGEESFDILVCNVKWVEQRLTDGPFSGRHYLIVSHFDPSQIRAFLNDFAGSCSGQNWHEVAVKLGRIGKWEFEDYVE